MFGISFAELLIAILIAVFFVKPQDWPEIAHFLGKFYAKIRNFIKNLKKQFRESQKEIGLDEIRQEFNLALAQEESKTAQEKTKIIDINGNIHEVDQASMNHLELEEDELKKEIAKYNKINNSKNPPKNPNT